MKELFLEKYQNKEYISQLLYECVKENFPNFDIVTYNSIILQNDYQKYKSYFENMFTNIDNTIKLDEEQIKAILADENYSLILAGAGTGKTTTICAKVKYLVDIKRINPQKILVMSYTKKATKELEKRIVNDFGIPAKVTTIHSLGYTYIREIFKPKKCYVVDDNLRKVIFMNYFQEHVFQNKAKLQDIINIFDKRLFSNHFAKNFNQYNNYQEYFSHYKEETIKETTNIEETVKGIINNYLNYETPRTILYEQTKSVTEAKIANFLYIHNIKYHYEKIYDELMDENRIYRPDFTINVGGEEIYIEYFGIDNDPLYKENQKLKEEYHRHHHNKFIALDNDNPLLKLKNELIKLNVPLRRKSYPEIYNQLLDNNKISQIYKFKNFLYDIIDTIKSSPKRQNYQRIVYDYLQTEPEILKKQFYYINEFYLYYQSFLYEKENYGFDFADMIFYANMYIKHIQNKNLLDYLYIIIDEYQDISYNRYELIKGIVNESQAKVIAVGDDFQTIFSFAGSKIEYIYDFEKYFPGTKKFKITHTYRNSQELIDYAGEFVMKNLLQIKKQLISNKTIAFPIKFVEYQDEYKTLIRLIKKIHAENKNNSILILGRTNKIIKRCFLEPELQDDIGTKIKFIGIEDLKIDGMTMHKAKGLTYDEVIIIGLNKKFPREDKNSFWLKSLLKEDKLNENIPYPEERRLFYVALTRTKNHVYLLIDKNKKNRSEFILELANIIKEHQKN